MSAVLIVDDNRANQMALKTALVTVGCETICVSDAGQALALLEENEFAVALIDVNMPGIDGYELARQIRATNRRLPIIFMTAAVESDLDLKRAYAANAVDIIHAPVNPDALRAKVKTFIELDQALSAARRAIAARSEFMQMAVHDLRAPLTVLSGYLSMLSAGDLVKLDVQGRRIVSVLSDKVVELERLLRDIADMALVEEGILVVDLKPTDISAAVQEALHRAEARSDLLDADIGTDSSNGTIWGQADKRLLGRVLDNLIDNAFKFSEGSPWIRIHIEAGPPPKITVEDHGRGVREEFPGQIFEKHFHLAARPGMGGGSGLGLYICQQLAHAQGADLKLDRSEVGKGSTFGLTMEPL